MFRCYNSSTNSTSRVVTPLVLVILPKSKSNFGDGMVGFIMVIFIFFKFIIDIYHSDIYGIYTITSFIWK